MKQFKIRTISGGTVRQTFFLNADSLEACAAECNITLVDIVPGWAFGHYSPTSSAEITWTI